MPLATTREIEFNPPHFGARYYSSSSGRFLSPDWAARPTVVPYAVFGDPQSLNLYGYVRDDPVSRADADGHCASGPGTCSLKQSQRRHAALQAKKSAAHQQGLTNVVYNETGSLRANPKAKPGAPGSAQDLAKGRQAIAEIANRVINAGHPNRVAPSTLGAKAALAVKTYGPAIAAYKESGVAARAALGGSNISNGATQYRTRIGTDVTTPVGESRSYHGTAVSQHYGPFIEGNHEVVIVIAQ